MDEQKRGFSMPLIPERAKKDMLWMWGALIVVTVAAGLLKYWEWISGELENPLDRVEAVLFMGMFVIIILGMAGASLAKLHFVPEGVAVTLFGITLKRRSAARIRLMTAVRYKDVDRIALCSYSLKELTLRAYDAKPELFRNSREYREGEWAHEYLYNQLHRNLLPDPQIDWIQWDPERLQALRQMYPQAQWMDLTKDRIFDEQLEEFSSENPR